MGRPVPQPIAPTLLSHPGNPFQQAAHSAIRISPGECRISDDPGVQLVTILGSCVAACVTDPAARIGGMNHFMLPKSDHGYWGPDRASLRFGNFAMEQLINDVLAHGGRRNHLEVKLFGGANLLRARSNVGWKNAAFAEAYVAAEGLTLVARHLYGFQPRLIHYLPVTGRVAMLELRDNTIRSCIKAESKHLRSLETKPLDGSIELFAEEGLNADPSPDRR